MQPEDLGVSSSRLERIGAMTHRYVDEGKLPGALTIVSRRGEVVYRDVYGQADVARGEPCREDTIFRIYSMTKPITSVGLMMLYEEGRLLLENPVSRFIPGFAETQVWDGGTADDFTTRAPDRTMTVRDLLTHQSGLTYGFQEIHPVDELYRRHDLGNFKLPDRSLAEAMDLLASLPLVFSPGTRWNYSVSTDVCGRIIEVVSGQSLDVYLEERIFEPLGMVDTGFSVPAAEAHRLAANYTPHLKTGEMREIDSSVGSPYHSRPAFLSGGGGLVSTASDYLRFCHCLLGGGELDGHRLLGRKTLEYMTQNHLTGGGTLNELGQQTFSEAAMEGMGFGLGFSVLVDAAANGAVSSAGEFAWGGAASTTFWIDPAEELAVVFMTQLLPSSSYPIRRQLKSTVYQALIN